MLKNNKLDYESGDKRCSCCGLPYPGKWVGSECELCHIANKAWGDGAGDEETDDEGPTAITED